MELLTQPQLTTAWRDVRDELRRAVGESAFEIWLDPSIRPHGTARSSSSRLRGRPSGGSQSVTATFSSACSYRSRSWGADHDHRRPFGSRAGRGTPEPASPPVSRADDSFNPRLSFDQFVMGAANRLAHAAALAVAENPGHAYNPLFLYGPPGLGKTHLLHAIGNYLGAFAPETDVRYTTVEAFTNGFITAISTRAVEHFKRLYRDADVLLIDDVQFLASKAKTEEEFFHTFNAIHDAGRQLVLTCDRVPSQLHAVEDRLRDRFQSGLVAALAPPDHTTRVTIFRKRAALDGISISGPCDPGHDRRPDHRQHSHA